MEGIVKFWNRTRQFGKILAKDVAEPVFVHRSEITDSKYRYLAEREPVEFDLVSTPKGQAATHVRRREPRFTGTISHINRKKRIGNVVSDDGYVELFFHYDDFSGDVDFRHIDEGENVDFAIAKDSGPKYRAKYITVDDRRPLERFALLPRWDERLQQLARLAAQENWNYRNAPSQFELPILHSYVHYTFKRIVAEKDKIAYADNPETKQRLASFNTGLLTAYFEPIYAAFHENREKDADVEWVLIGFFKESQSPMTYFAVHPERANYFDNPTDLLYDRKTKLVKDLKHIIDERAERFPEKFRENPNLHGILNMAVEQAERRVMANYKTAIPQFNHGRIQLLLPLCLEDPRRADLALVVGREGAVYKGYTVLTLDQAYNNARLLTRPDDEWLQP